MIEQTPPDIMTTEERLSEIASLLARACERLRERAKLKGYTRLSPYITGLHAERNRHCYEDIKNRIRQKGKKIL